MKSKPASGKARGKTASPGTSSAPAPSPTEGEIVTLDHAEYLLRALKHGDENYLQDFFYSHKPDTVRQRYGYMIKDMTPERAHALVSVDQSKDAAYALFDPSGETIHAVGRYYLDADGRTAEAAFVVRESLQHHGLGNCLLKFLTDLARTRGLSAIWAQVMPDNHPMIHLFQKHHFARSEVTPDAHTFYLPLQEVS